MYCVFYIDGELRRADIADSDETRYLISLPNPSKLGDLYGYEYFSEETIPSDQYQTPRDLIWKDKKDVVVYDTEEECKRYIDKLMNLK